MLRSNSKPSSRRESKNWQREIELCVLAHAFQNTCWCSIEDYQAWTFRNWEWAMSKAKKDDVEARRNNRLEAYVILSFGWICPSFSG
jgi:hypothetical protein